MENKERREKEDKTARQAREVRKASPSEASCRQGIPATALEGEDACEVAHANRLEQHWLRSQGQAMPLQCTTVPTPGQHKRPFTCCLTLP